MKDLYRTRNMRLAFKDGFYVGGLKAGLMTLTGGRFPRRKIVMEPDAAVPRRAGPAGGGGGGGGPLAGGETPLQQKGGGLQARQTATRPQPPPPTPGAGRA